MDRAWLRAGLGDLRSACDGGGGDRYGGGGSLGSCHCCLYMVQDSKI